MNTCLVQKRQTDGAFQKDRYKSCAKDTAIPRIPGIPGIEKSGRKADWRRNIGREDTHRWPYIKL